MSSTKREKKKFHRMAEARRETRRNKSSICVHNNKFCGATAVTAVVLCSVFILRATHHNRPEHANTQHASSTSVWKRFQCSLFKRNNYCSMPSTHNLTHNQSGDYRLRTHDIFGLDHKVTLSQRNGRRRKENPRKHTIFTLKSRRCVSQSPMDGGQASTSTFLFNHFKLVVLF